MTALKNEELTVKTAADLAHEVLNANGTPYKEGKDLISGYFRVKEKINKNLVFTRLVLIDSIYSTNMGFKYYALSDLAVRITQTGGDEEFKDMLSKYEDNNFIEKDKKTIESLFKSGYGIKKSGEADSGLHAHSLIPKYAYFLTGYKFPILDSLAELSYKILFGQIDKKEYVEYFKKLKEQKNTIKDYNKLDSLLWLMGKVVRGNGLSMMYNKENYRSIVRAFIPEQQRIKSKECDKMVVFKTINLLNNNNKPNIDGIDLSNLLKFSEFVFANVKKFTKNNNWETAFNSGEKDECKRIKFIKKCYKEPNER